MADVYDKVNSATRNGGVYILPGVYDVTIKACKHIDGRKSPCFVVELDVLTSSNPARPAGSSMSWVVNLNQDAGPANVREFASSILGVPFESVTGDVVRGLVHASNPLGGTKAKLAAANVKTRSGGDFTKVQWTPVVA